jgi:hypothetical protein
MHYRCTPTLYEAGLRVHYRTYKRFYTQAASLAGPSRLSTPRLLPDSNEPPNLPIVLLVALHVAIVRTLYMRVRYGGWCVVSRGTWLKIGRVQAAHPEPLVSVPRLRPLHPAPFAARRYRLAFR